MHYVIAGLSVTMLVMFIYFKSAISVLEADRDRLAEDVKSLQIDVINADRNTAVCKLALSEQTKDIEVLKIDYVKNVAELDKWKSMPPEIRYNTVYKTITKKVDYSKGECNETKELINNISNINYVDL